MKLQGNWSLEDKRFLMENLRRLTTKQIAEVLGRSETAVKLFLYRHRLPVGRQVKSPTVVKLLQIKFGDANWFTPDRSFYEQVGIGQRRWQKLAWGYANPTEEELRQIARVLKLSVEDSLQLLDASQLNLFDDNENSES